MLENCHCALQASSLSRSSPSSLTELKVLVGARWASNPKDQRKRGFILSHVHILKRLGILRDRIGNMSFVGDMDLVVHMNVQILRSDVIAMSGKGEASYSDSSLSCSTKNVVFLLPACCELPGFFFGEALLPGPRCWGKRHRHTNGPSGGKRCKLSRTSRTSPHRHELAWPWHRRRCRQKV